MSLRSLPLMGRLDRLGFPQHHLSNLEDFLRLMDSSNGPLDIFSGSNGSVELYKTEDGWILKAQVPGFKKEEIDLDVSKNHISINAYLQEAVTGSTSDPKLVRGGFPTNLQYREQVPGTMDPSSAEAELVNGILTVKVKSVAKTQQPNKVVIK